MFTVIVNLNDAGEPELLVVVGERLRFDVKRAGLKKHNKIS